MNLDDLLQIPGLSPAPTTARTGWKPSATDTAAARQKEALKEKARQDAINRFRAERGLPPIGEEAEGGKSMTPYLIAGAIGLAVLLKLRK